MHEEAAVVVPALRAALGLGDPVLVGHRDGGSIALVHAATHPVAGVVVLAPHVIAEPASTSGWPRHATRSTTATSPCGWHVTTGTRG